MAAVFQRVASAIGQSVTIDIGAADNNRLLICQYGDESVGTDDAAMGGTPSVDGKNFTLRIAKTNPDGFGNQQEMWTIDEAALGASNGSLSVSGGGVDAGTAIRVELWYGIDSGVPSDTGFDDTTIAPTDSSITMDCPASGIVVLGYGNGNSFSSSGWTSPLTERVDAATNPPSSAGLGYASGIETSAQTGKTYTATGTVTLRSSMLGMSFAEAATDILLISASTISLTSTALLTTEIPLASASSIGLTSAVILTTEITFTSVSTIDLTSAATLTTEINLASVSTIDLISAAILTTEIPLIAASTISADVTSAVLTSAPVEFISLSTIDFTSTAILTVDVAFISASTIDITIVSVLTTEIPLSSASIVSINITTAILITPIEFISTSTIDINSAAILRIQALFNSSSDVTISCVGILSVAPLFNSASTIDIISAALLTTAIPMSSASSISVSLANSITTEITLVSASTITVVSTGFVSVAPRFIASLNISVLGVSVLRILASVGVRFKFTKVEDVLNHTLVESNEICTIVEVEIFYKILKP